MYDRGKHNIVKKLSSNKKNNYKIKQRIVNVLSYPSISLPVIYFVSTVTFSRYFLQMEW